MRVQFTMLRRLRTATDDGDLSNSTTRFVKIEGAGLEGMEMELVKTYQNGRYSPSQVNYNQLETLWYILLTCILYYVYRLQ